MLCSEIFTASLKLLDNLGPAHFAVVLVITDIVLFDAEAGE